MLVLPHFLMVEEELPDHAAQVQEGVALTGHFIETRLLPALHRKTPPLRTHFCGLLSRLAA
jgi:hypothetical protein